MEAERRRKRENRARWNDRNRFWKNEKNETAKWQDSLEEVEVEEAVVEEEVDEEEAEEEEDSSRTVFYRCLYCPSFNKT